MGCKACNYKAEGVAMPPWKGFCSASCASTYGAWKKMGFQCEVSYCGHCARTMKYDRTKHGQKRKFCSKSCAAAHNNRQTPKRQLKLTFCKECGCQIERENTKDRRTLCVFCNPSFRWMYSSIAELRSEGNANHNSRLPHIRGHARQLYISAGRPLACQICGYDVHVEICHVKPVSSFGENAIVADVNSQENLVALCRNHHWELDNGILEL